MVKKMDNRGLTLVELVIAVAISTMIVGAAGIFLYNAQRTYRIAEHSINLQMESQILMEQMSNWAMESNKVFYTTDTVNAAYSNVVLVLYDIPRYNGKNLSEVYPDDYSYSADSNKASRRIFFCKDGKLYMKYEEGIDKAQEQYDNLVSNATPASLLYSDADAIPENCIGEYVNKFEVANIPSDAAMATLGAVQITLGMVEGSQSYTMSDVFSLRNGLHIEATPTPGPTTAPEEGG